MKTQFNHLLTFLILLSPFGIKFIIKNSNLFKTTYVHNELKGKEFDYVILGSSRGLTTLNTNLIDSITQLQGFNACSDGAGIATNILMLKHLISNNIKFKYCIFSLDEIGISDDVYRFSKNTYRFAPFADEKYIKETINKFENTREKKLFQFSALYPGFLFCENNKPMLTAALKVIFNKRARNKFDEMGNFTYPVIPANKKSVIYDTINFTHFGQVYADLRDLCGMNNVKLITYIAPIEGRYLQVPSVPDLVNHSNLFDNTEYFFDNLHVNAYGRRKASLEFSKIFK